MRLFIAIDLPADIKEYVKSLQQTLPDGGLSKTRDFHLTLKFLGECDEKKQTRIESALEKIPFAPFEARLGGIGSFGGASPRVLWISLDAPESLYTAAAAIGKAASKLCVHRP